MDITAMNSIDVGALTKVPDTIALVTVRRPPLASTVPSVRQVCVTQPVGNPLEKSEAIVGARDTSPSVPSEVDGPTKHDPTVPLLKSEIDVSVKLPIAAQATPTINRLAITVIKTNQVFRETFNISDLLESEGIEAARTAFVR